MSKPIPVKVCLDCREESDDFYTARASYCRACARKRAVISMAKQRERKVAQGLPINFYKAEQVKAERYAEEYLERHLAKREVEATNCLSNSTTNDSEVLDFIKQEGGWRDQVNYFLRQPTKSFQFQVR